MFVPLSFSRSISHIGFSFVLQGEEVVPAKPEPPTPAIGGGANRQSAQPQANQPVPSTMSRANRKPIQPQANQPLPSTMSGANRQPIPPQASQPVPSMISGANRQPVHSQANQPLPSTMSTHGADVDPRQLQCPAWNDGYCPRGRHCNMQHLHRVTHLYRPSPGNPLIRHTIGSKVANGSRTSGCQDNGPNNLRYHQSCLRRGL